MNFMLMHSKVSHFSIGIPTFPLEIPTFAESALQNDAKSVSGQ